MSTAEALQTEARKRLYVLPFGLGHSRTVTRGIAHSYLYYRLQ